MNEQNDLWKVHNKFLGLRKIKYQNWNFWIFAKDQKL